MNPSTEPVRISEIVRKAAADAYERITLRGLVPGQHPAGIQREIVTAIQSAIDAETEAKELRAALSDMVEAFPRGGSDDERDRAACKAVDALFRYPAR